MNHPPTAVILALGQPDADGRVTLNGSTSFDPDDGDTTEACSVCGYKWDVLTPAYFYLKGLFDDGDSATDDDSVVAVTGFTVPSDELADIYGSAIEFQLTVTDAKGATGIATATYLIRPNRAPTADITVTAKLFDHADIPGHDDNGNGEVDENEERYTLEGVIHAPGVEGNADNEWHIRERSLLVVDGSGSFDPDGPLPATAFQWELLYHSDAAAITRTLPIISGGQKVLSTDENPDVVGTTTSETIGRLPFVGGVPDNSYYLYYRLTVTDEHGASDSAVVKIEIHDAHDNPTVEISHPESEPEASTDPERREGIQPAGQNRYVVVPEIAEEGVTLTAVGEGDGTARTRELVHTWSGPHLEPSESNEAGAQTTAVFTAPVFTLQGEPFVFSVQVVDPSGLTGSDEVELVVVENTPPRVTVPDDIDTFDGNNGGYPGTDPLTGMVRLVGFGVDIDGDPLTFQWEQVQNELGDPLRATDRVPRLSLRDSDTQITSFRLPEVTQDTQNTLYVQFTATDRWGVSASDIVTIIVRRGQDDLRAIAGADQKVEAGDVVLLRGNFGLGLASEEALDTVQYQWAYVGIETHPRIADRPPITVAEAAEGFVPGEWLADASDVYASDAGGRVRSAGERFPYFVAPELGGFNSVKLIFDLTVRNNGDRHTDTVTVTVVGPFFSGVIDGPDFCANQSLGGPTTHPVDSDDDGMADACSLKGTRRAAIARQKALETLAGIFVEDFKVALHGTPDDPDTQVDESTEGTCAAAPVDLRDEEDDLAQDVCGRASDLDDPQRNASFPPPPVDLELMPVFFSGVVDGPYFCANLSLGGPVMYPHDSDEDGTADVCALAFTRRETVARHMALEAVFADHPQFPAALAAACAALGTLDFGDHPDDLAVDACNPPSGSGTPLPTPSG